MASDTRPPGRHAWRIRCSWIPRATHASVVITRPGRHASPPWPRPTSATCPRARGCPVGSSSAPRAETWGKRSSLARSSGGSARRIRSSASRSLPLSREKRPARGEAQAAASAPRSKGISRSARRRASTPEKDTARMLESGAHRVFWVRCRRQRMHAAIEALPTRLDPGALVVAESNSLAQAVEPDVFLMVKSARSASVKPTAAVVMPLASRVVVSSDGAFDLSPRSTRRGGWRVASHRGVGSHPRGREEQPDGPG